jgi:hypothetical protein
LPGRRPALFPVILGVDFEKNIEYYKGNNGKRSKGMAKSSGFAESSKERFEIGKAQNVNLSIGGSFEASKVGTLSISEGNTN